MCVHVCMYTWVRNNQVYIDSSGYAGSIVYILHMHASLLHTEMGVLIIFHALEVLSNVTVDCVLSLASYLTCKLTS